MFLPSGVLTTVTVCSHSERHGPWFSTGLQGRQIEAEDLYGLGLAVLERRKAGKALTAKWVLLSS